MKIVYLLVMSVFYAFETLKKILSCSKHMIKATTIQSSILKKKIILKNQFD